MSKRQRSNDEDFNNLVQRPRLNESNYAPSLVAQNSNFDINSVFDIMLYYPAHTGAQLDASGIQVEVQVEESYKTYHNCLIIFDNPLSIVVTTPESGDMQITICKHLICQVRKIRE